MFQIPIELCGKCVVPIGYADLPLALHNPVFKVADNVFSSIAIAYYYYRLV